MEKKDSFFQVEKKEEEEEENEYSKIWDDRSLNQLSSEHRKVVQAILDAWQVHLNPTIQTDSFMKSNEKDKQDSTSSVTTKPLFTDVPSVSPPDTFRFKSSPLDSFLRHDDDPHENENHNNNSNKRKTRITLADLFQRVDANYEQELQELAYEYHDENEKKQRTLSELQLQSIRKYGTFTIPSQRYPNQHHVWKVNSLLQKGKENIRETYQQDLSSSLAPLLVDFGDDWVCMKKAYTHIQQTLRSILSSFLGLPELRSQYSTEEIQTLLLREKQHFIWSCLQTQPQFDSRLYDEELQKTLQPILQKMEEQHLLEWETKKSQHLQSNIRNQIIKNKYHGSYKNTWAMERLISEKLQEAQWEDFNEYILHSSILHRKFPGCVPLLLHQRIAIRISQQVEQSRQEYMISQSQRIQQNILDSYPICSKHPIWLHRKVQQEMDILYPNVQWEFLSKITDQLHQRQLEQEAYISEKDIEFQKEKLPSLQTSLEGQKIAARTFTMQKRIWNSKHWIRLSHPSHESRCDASSGGAGSSNPVTFYPQKCSDQQVSTKQWFWRLRLLITGTTTMCMNSLYHLLVSNLWNSPIGIKTLFTISPFYARKTMDSHTGDIIDDESSITFTFVSNFKRLWRDISESRLIFESTLDVGFLGKKYTRWINKCWNYGVKGFIGSVSLAVFQPFVTMSNLIISCTLAVTSPLWSLGINLLAWAFSIFILDVHYPGDSDILHHPSHSYFPLLFYFLFDIVFLGFGRLLFNTLRGFFYEPFLFALLAIFAIVKKATRTLWDALMANLILPHAHIPAADTFSAVRIHGPGLASKHFYQIQKEIAVMALCIALEREELQMFYHEKLDIINKPLRDYYAFFQRITQPFGVIDVSNHPYTKKLIQIRDEETRMLESAFQNQDRKLQAIIELPPCIPGSIKLKSEELERVMSISTKIVESFYNERLAPRLQKNSVDEFWHRKGIEISDFYQLMNYYYTQIIDESFLLPLEETDKDYCSEVSEERLDDILKYFPHSL